MTKEQFQAQLDAVYSSTSWKITAPLRYCASIFKRGPGRSKALRFMSFQIVRAIGRLPFVRKSGALILKLFPALRHKVRQIIIARNVNSLMAIEARSSALSDHRELSPSAMLILEELRSVTRKTRP